jgi:hypothetical protein
MQGFRDLLRDQLGRSLAKLSDRDRLDAAWTVACGPALAARGRVVSFTDDIVRVQVEGDLWLDQFLQLGPVLRAELSRIAAVRVGGIHFEKASAIRTMQPTEDYGSQVRNIKNPP